MSDENKTEVNDHIRRITQARLRIRAHYLARMQLNEGDKPFNQTAEKEDGGGSGRRAKIA